MKNALLTITATLAGLLVCLLVDFAVVSRLMRDPDLPCSIYAGDARGFYWIRPNLINAWCAWGTTTSPVRTDANGFRINESGAAVRPADVIFLGDSFTFGINGPWAETFVGMFERLSGRSVVNTGVVSYSLTAYLYQYRKAVAAGVLKKAHTVVAAVDISDVQDEASVWEEGPTSPQKRRSTQTAQDEQPPSWWQRFLSKNFIGSKSLYYAWVRWRTSRAAEIEPTETFDQPRSAFTWKGWSELDALDGDTYHTYRPAGVHGGIELVSRRLHTLAQLVAQNGGTLWMLIYPWPAQLRHADDVFDWQQFVGDICADVHCAGTVNAFPLFRDYARHNPTWYRDLYVFGDVHLNVRGNRMIADELVRVLGQSAPAR